MPLGLLLILTLAIMGFRKGLDFPQCALAAALGDRSNGTIIQQPVDMIGQFVDLVWGLVNQAWSSTPKPLSEGLIHAAHVAHASGVIG
jgi:hypothetical protein